MSYHILTFGMRLPNIARVAVFTELVRKKLPASIQGNSIIDNIANKRSFSLRMLGTPKFIEETGEHIRVKKAIRPKDGTIFDFMIRAPNDESEVVKSSLLDISEPKVKICDDTNSEADLELELKVVEKFLEEASIEGFNLSFPSEASLNIFPLKRMSPSYCSLCDREHTNDNAYIIRNKESYSFHCYREDQEKPLGERKPSIKLTLSETALSREKNLPAPVKLEQSRISNPNDCFVWWDLIRMCTSGKKFSRAEVYEAIQTTIAYIETEKPFWVLK
ncbi:hypothetical protein RhiirC2_802767, partial [Rhizophagus irregularis]